VFYHVTQNPSPNSNSNPNLNLNTNPSLTYNVTEKECNIDKL